MDFNKYMIDVWRPMQQQALARGMNPKDVDTRQSMTEYLTPRYADQVKADAAKKKLGLAHRELDLKGRHVRLDEKRAADKRNAFQRSKRVAPWAIGLDIADVGVSGLQGLNQRNQDIIDRQTLLRNFDEYQRNQYKRKP